MSSQSLTGRKRRFFNDSEPQTPVRRRKVSNGVETVKQVLKRQGVENQKDDNKKPNCLLSSPTDVSDTKVMQQTRQVRTKQAKLSGLPNLDPIVTKVDQEAKDEEVSELETEVEAEALTPRPSVPRRTARPPLSRRMVGLNRARFGVGIVRYHNWRLSGEDTETEDECPASSPRPSHNRPKTLVSPMEASGCGCAEENSVDEKLEDQIGTSVLPIDPSVKCFDRNCDDQWQLRSPPPEDFVPENS